jgi:hypothetical protein
MTEPPVMNMVSQPLPPAVLLTVAAAIIVGTLGLVGVLRTASVARAVHNRQTAIEGWQQWREDAKALRAERDSERERHQREMDALRTELLGDCESRVGRVSERIDQLVENHARELAAVETRLDATVDWIRAVVPIMRAKGIEFPPPPRGILDTDPGGILPVRRRDGI